MAQIFSGVRVLDLTNNLAGPHAAAMLADYGAEVIKIEKPGGDDNRHWTPFVEGVSLYGLTLNRGKKSIVLDLAKFEAKEILKELIASADVILESFRPGTIAKMGFGYEEVSKIKPDIIMCSVSGFGQTGPMRLNPGYDVIAQALSGLMYMTGDPHGQPTKIGTAVGDWTGGLTAFGAIASALYHQAKTGEGQYIDVSLLDALVYTNENVDSAANGAMKPSRAGNHHSYLCPYGVFQGNDGDVIIATVSPKLWDQLCNVMGQPELANNPLFNTSALRAKNQHELIAIIEKWVKSFESVNEVRDLLDKNGIPTAKVNSVEEVIDNNHILARDMVVDLNTKAITAGKVKTRGLPVKFSKTPGKVTFASAVGENTDEILKLHIGYDEEKITELRGKGVLG